LRTELTHQDWTAHFSLQQRHALAALLRRNGAEPVASYAKSLVQNCCRNPIDPLLLNAIEAEFRRKGHTDAHQLSGFVKRRRVLQTTIHLGLSDGPTFLNAHALVASALQVGEPYFAGAFSGIPFSTASRPGMLSFGADINTMDLLNPMVPLAGSLYRGSRERQAAGGDDGVSLIPSRLRRSPVWATQVADEARTAAAALSTPLAELVMPRSDEVDFPVWASRVNAQFLSLALRRRTVYFDINAVVADLLCKAAEIRMHPLSRMVSNKELHGGLLERTCAPLLYMAQRQANGLRFEPLWYRNGLLVGRHVEVEWDIEQVLRAFETGEFWPGMFLMVASLLLCGVKPIGGVTQLEYTEYYARLLVEAGCLDEEAAQELTLATLCCGRARNAAGKDMCSLDAFFGTRLLEVDQRDSVLTFFEPQLRRIWGAPFTKLGRQGP
jgi:hypothetical protein